MYKVIKDNMIYLTLILILSITVICASFNEKLIVDGVAYIRVDEDVRVTNVTLSSVTSAYESYNAEYSKDSVNLYVTLPSLESTITYNIEVTNKTDYVYVISSLDKSLSNSNITYTIDNEVGSLLKADGKTYITVTFMYDSCVTTLPTDTTDEVIFTFDFGIKLDFTIDGETVDTDFPSKSDGYITAEVSCDNDVTANFDAVNWKLSNVNINDGVSATCTINFTTDTASFDFTESERTITILTNDTYKLETWGANYYDYTVSSISLNEGDILYFNVGGTSDDEDATKYNSYVTSVASVSGLYSSLSESDLYVASKSSGSSYIADSLGNKGVYCYDCSVDGVNTTLDSSSSIISRFSSKNNGYAKISKVSDQNVAKIGTVEYLTLQDAFDAASSNTQTTVTLINDSVWAAIVDSNKNIVLDLSSYDTEDVINNGTFTLEEGTYTTDNFSIYNYGTLSMGDGINITTNTRTLISNYSGGNFTISGTAEITSLSSGYVLFTNYGEVSMTGGTLTALAITVILNNSGGVFTMTDGTLNGESHYVLTNSGTSTLSGGIITNQSSSGKNLITNTSGATLTISDSMEVTSLSTSYMAINNYGNLDMTGGTVTALSTYCLQNYSGGVFTMTGGTMLGDTTYVLYNKAGTMNLKGGIITNSSTSSNCLINNQSGAILNISGTVEITSLSSKYIGIPNYGELNISGGTVTVLSSYAIRNSSTGVLTMTGGSIISNSYGLYNNGGTSTLSGGSFTNQTTSAKCLINNGSTGTLYILGTVEITSLSSSNVAIANNGVFNMSGGTITALSTAPVRNNSGATFTMTGGSLVADTSNALYNYAGTSNLSGGTILNQSTSSRGLINNQSGAILNISGSVEITTLSSGYVGVSNSGELNMSGGTITGLVTTTFQNNSTGTFTMTGGTIVGDTGYATFYNKAGTATLSGGTIKSSSTSAGSVLNNYTGGTLNITGTVEIISATSLYAGFINEGTLNLSGGTLTALSNVVMKNNSGGVFNMTGGSIVGSASYGLYNNAGTSTLSGGSITTGDAYAVNNTGTSSSTATLIINGTITITNNSSTYSTIYNGSYSSIDTSDISNATIKNNNSSGSTGL